MAYARKLTIAKILVSLALAAYALLPLLMNFGESHITTRNGTFYGNILALPIMLWTIWGKKLHGTGRSVRLMAFIGIAFTLGFFIAAAFSDTFGAQTNLIMHATVLVVLLLGVFLSIRRGNDAE